MPLDLVSFGIGIGSGIVGAGLAFTLSQRATARNPESTKVASHWALSEVSRGVPPALMVERLEGLPVPRGAKVLVPDANAVPYDVLRSCDVRVNPDVNQNYAVGRDVALVFSSHVHPKAHAVYTREDAAVRKLQAEFQRVWMQAEPYVEPVSIEAVPSREGRNIEVVGTAAEWVEFRGRRMLRLTANGKSVGVVTEDSSASSLQGNVVRVAGRVVREADRVFVEALRIERASPRALAPTPNA